MDCHANRDARLRHRNNLVVVTDHERCHDLALLAGELHATNTLTTAALDVEVVELSPLAISGFGHNQNRRVVTGHVDGDDSILVILQLHATHASCRTTHRADIVLVEANRHAAT